MSRIKELQKYVHHVVEDNEKEANQIAHLHGVALAAAILAKKRGFPSSSGRIAAFIFHPLFCIGQESDGKIQPWSGK